MEKKTKQLVIKVVIGILLFGASFFLLGDDTIPFLLWWVVVTMIGCTFMPLTSQLFSKFDDRGWLFSKVIGVAASGYLTWLLVVLKLVSFQALTCMIITVLCMAANLVLALRLRRSGKEILAENSGNLIFREEVIFFLVFLLWTYVVGFRPEAYGTEKFMDFGFMQSMMKSTTLPAVDMWYSEGTLNYYYGGQYFAVFLTKLTTTSVAVAYNLMRTLVAAFAFVLPFSLVRQMLKDRMELDQERKQEERRKKKKNKVEQVYKYPEMIAGLGGILAAAAVSLSGNMHYIIYSKIIPLVRKLTGAEAGDSYWFPNATRYIGHDPDTADKTIHEFPCYSFVLGDLHAHMVNIFFVLTVIGLLYAWLRNNKGKSYLQPVVLVCGIFLGMFQFCNYWDFVIYYVVICGTLFFGNLKRYWGRMRQGIGWSVVQWIQVMIVAMIVALPFNLTFDSGMAQGIVISKNHSAFYQLCVLWALPVIICVTFIVKYLIGLWKKKFGEFFRKTACADLFAVILALCAIGLIVIPEIVYVKDIYEATSARSNTMFKLTYQAYIMFGLAMGYILTRFITEKVLQEKRRRIQQIFGVVMTCILVSTFGYLGNSVHSWFGNVFDRSGYKTLDATAFLENSFSEDASAIRWLNDNIEGRPVVLEANGDSYSDYERVSAMTGLPTVMGWYVHEWLWRNDTDDLNLKAADIQTIYTSTDQQQVEELLEQYDVSYIFIGAQEREKYPEMDEEFLESLGEVVFKQGATIVQVK